MERGGVMVVLDLVELFEMGDYLEPDPSGIVVVVKPI